MRPLIHSACEYLAAGGYTVCRNSDDLLELERPKGDDVEKILIWGHQHTDNADNNCRKVGQSTDNERERLLLESFRREMQSTADAIGYCVVDRKLGLSKTFISEAKKALGENGGILTPIEFFDLAYRVDGIEGKRNRSVMGDLLIKADTTRRVTQPFYQQTSLSQEDRIHHDGDIVDHLHRATQLPGPKLRILQGSAGGGKTVAFNALVSSLFAEFIAAKRARRESRRPIAFLPHHLRNENIGYVDDVIAGVMNTDAAEAVTTKQFRWLLRNGKSIWLFDGLDEFYAGSEDFLSFLREELTAPDSDAQIVLCTRDSLMNSSAALRSFVEERMESGNEIEIYGVLPWTGDAWHKLAKLESEFRNLGSEDRDLADEFRKAIETSPILRELARLPFYCRLLFEIFADHRSLDVDEFSVIEFLLRRILDREQGKNIFRWKDFVDVDQLTSMIRQEFSRFGIDETAELQPRDMLEKFFVEEGREILLEVLETIAHEQYLKINNIDRREEIAVEDVRRLPGLSDVRSDIADRLRTTLAQLALFGPGRSAGYIDFTHPILAEYLAARHAAKLLKREILMSISANGSEEGGAVNQCIIKGAMKNALGKSDYDPGSVFGRAFARQISDDPELYAFLYGDAADDVRNHSLESPQH